MSKRQGVGKFELAQANKNLSWLKDKLEGKSNAHQYHAVSTNDKVFICESNFCGGRGVYNGKQ